MRNVAGQDGFRGRAVIVGLAALGAVIAACSPKLAGVRDTDKQILDRLEAREKTLRGIEQRLASMPAASRPQIDPNKVYDIPIGKSPVRGPKNARVALVEFSDFQ